MRASILIPLLAMVLGLAAGAARAQSEDERILQSEPPADRPAQHRDDDELDDEELDDQVFYSGMGLERVSTDFDNLGEATNLQAVLGFRIPTVPWFGVEIDIGQTIIPGEYRDPDPGSPFIPGTCIAPNNPPGCTPDQPAQPAEDGAFDNSGDEFGMQALGLSAVFRTTGRIYFTGRYGYRYLATSNDRLNENRSGNGFGAGVGYRWGKGLSGVELSYKQLGEDVDSIGLVFFVRSMRR